jgi:antitoxin component YwqK of YwqJK toxin-antitoxin module
MKKLLLVLIFLSSVLFAEVQVKKYDNGEVKSKVTLKNGKRNGLAQGFYRGGSLKYETIFKNDKREGLAKAYFKTGKIKSEQNYKGGFLNGVSKKYHKNGRLKSKFTFMDDLPLSGTAYSKNGEEIK